MEEVNVGDIYCYSDKSFLSPSLYKSKRRTSGLGIVVSSLYGVTRVVNFNAHNKGKKYKFMEGNCMTDYIDVTSSANGDAAKRDLAGLKNSYYISQSSKIEGHEFSWCTKRYLNDIEYTYRDESDWYLPSLGELERLRGTANKILGIMDDCKLTNYTLYELLKEFPYLISSTQKSDKMMYSLDMRTGKALEVLKDSEVYGVSFKRVSP